MTTSNDDGGFSGTLRPLLFTLRLLDLQPAYTHAPTTTKPATQQIAIISAWVSGPLGVLSYGAVGHMCVIALSRPSEKNRDMALPASILNSIAAEE
jgi:hypothetical protein